MADLSSIEASQTVIVVGANSTGVEQTPVKSTSNGSLHVSVRDDNPATFSLLCVSIPLGNNKSMVSLVNTGTSVVKIQTIKIVNNQNAAVTGVIADFRFKRITGHSSGTLVVPQTFDTADVLDSFITARTGATIIGENSADLMRCEWSSDEWGVGTNDVEAQDHANQQLGYVYQNFPKTKPITLRQNDGISIKCITNSSNGSFDFEIIFTQE